MKTFHIRVDGKEITMETSDTKFNTLEWIMFMISRHYFDKGKVDELEGIIRIIDAKIENFKDGFRSCTTKE